VISRYLVAGMPIFSRADHGYIIEADK